MSVRNQHYESLLDQNNQSYLEKFNNGTNIDNETTWDGKKIFPITHDQIVEEWKDSDYQLAFSENGYCQNCVSAVVELHQPSKIVSEKGILRFGVNVGFCLTCMYACIKGRQSELLRLEIPFIQSDLTHTFTLTIDKLHSLLTRLQTFSDVSNLQKEEKASQEEVGLLEYIVKQNTSLLEQAQREKEKPYQCKKCRKVVMISDKFAYITDARKAGRIFGCCLGCSQFYTLVDGCSMLTCAGCITKTKTCIVCMDGAAEKIAHDLKKCSDVMKSVMLGTGELPEIKRCVCNDT